MQVSQISSEMFLIILPALELPIQSVPSFSTE